ncbi:RIP metalloprotease RseP [Rhodopseudomonas pseudopalustris]|uniref:Zinc metalloprotease n=2 Tax=Rhodopseudomonas TaxID=1073 RepID=Q136B1_RHOPS|nr:RIP metalloprotease RseP [Rhodopseudomonas pseudopalustris]ABE40078.1 RseP peptidase. Metallo peptidase. MEROPS family M50B [Rhodopseudomonas palustris BisB5]MBB1091241.1 RIP metalloprotease RseP [Rhodopseudomonas palustris]SEO87811.1 site-2 protease. Metallo peptidase. MEROPS family M50B [Rhodopseudomonas pseudopalustris]
MADIFMNGFSTLSHGIVGYVVPFLFVLTIVVFFHELGHFLVARWNGVKVLTFSLGFGPEIAGFNDRHGTRWKLSAIPLGGYVKFFGDDSEASTPSNDSLSKMSADERSVSFHHKGVGPRAAIVVAGPLANFILAIVLFTFLFAVFGVPSTSARVDAIQPGSAAEAGGFQAGDVILAIDGSPIHSFLDMQRKVGGDAGREMKFTVQRGSSTIDLKATPELREIKDRFGNVQRLGILGISRSTTANEATTERVNPAVAVWMGIKETWFVVDRTFSYIGGLFAGREAADQLGGPLRIAQISGQVATIGFTPLLHLAAVLSISIGLLNLFPVPLLDGGHLMFYAIEAVRGRPLSERAQEMGFRIGLGLVLMLMVFATYNDILHLASS